MGKLDFLFKLGIFLMICGVLNHVRDIIQDGAGHSSFWKNLADASFTALPMCTFALLLIGHLHSLQKRLYLQATRDLLTGLHNRRWFMDNSADHISLGQALLIADIDRFKAINDTFGHETGDRCLQEMAQHLRKTLRQSDACARIGGEEFAILLNDVSREITETIAERVSAGFEFAATPNETLVVTSSVGVCADAVSRDEAFKVADQAVYRAKAAGRARYIMAPPSADGGSAKELRSAVA
ncbi:GGDEF domain-containing protein [Cognatiyoonia sp. IB215446]|uniref:GGDEF domain-containing protein n=1 Tax=Cognatiyoonia sp. IB215446 TaxID=3097355 RepID=UPI002A0E69D7|nr:GGDEF domain-containing protein [Cognatiyoonia sp. IB215446]MDX8349867.1 GGDEF domain-containing protein [Cognatiyoonia sp. IB215446]